MIFINFITKADTGAAYNGFVMNLATLTKNAVNFALLPSVLLLCYLLYDIHIVKQVEVTAGVWVGIGIILLSVIFIFIVNIMFYFTKKKEESK